MDLTIDNQYFIKNISQNFKYHLLINRYLNGLIWKLTERY